MFGDRLKELRKTLNLTQQKFADRLGVPRNNIASYESGLRSPSDAMFNLICRTFDVNETWLREGTGPMFRTLSRQEELTEACARLLRDEQPEFRQRLIIALARLDESGWQALEAFARSLVEDEKED